MGKRIPVLSFHSRDVHYPPATVVMPHFAENKEKKIAWFSPSFYSHPQGYKLCVKVAPNGELNGEDTHVSAYVHVMQGEHDDSLSWPFRAVVELKLLNRQADENHITFSANFENPTSDESNKQVFSSNLTDSGSVAWEGEGADKLIKHSELGFNPDKQREFLKDDSLFIRITAVRIDAGSPHTSDPATGQVAQFSITKFVQFNFTFEHFSKHKLKNNKWESPPFYTHPGGYRFVMVVQANGEYTYKGKFLAIFMHLVKGEYDDNLKWPFRGTIYVQAVNQMEDKNHVEYPVKFNEKTDPDGKLGARVKTASFDNIVVGRSTEGWGLANFLSHDLLAFNKYRNTKYLSGNDEIFFRIPRVELSN